VFNLNHIPTTRVSVNTSSLPPVFRQKPTQNSTWQGKKKKKKKLQTVGPLLNQEQASRLNFELEHLEHARARANKKPSFTVVGLTREHTRNLEEKSKKKEKKKKKKHSAPGQGCATE
jgi:hypothetical protein